MKLFDAGILGAVQGLTEFLPVSSSGHLVLAQSLIHGFKQPGVLFDVVLHFGTLFAVLYYFWKKILSLKIKYLVLLIIGTIPAALFGYFFDSQLETAFGNVKWVAIGLIVTGVLNLLVDKFSSRKKLITIKNSFLIGIAQAIAIIPGISRSGATIFAGTAVGIDKKEVADFTFLLSVPAVLGANVLQFVKHGLTGEMDILYYQVGLVTSFIVGVISIKFVYKFLKEKKFKYFGLYTIALGVIFLIFFK